MLKVLIADDEQLICRLVQILADWETLGMEVVGTAENGLEALEKIENLQPDILITDIRMPGLSGLELIEEAKRCKPDLEVMIISGYAHFEYAQSAIKFGVGNYLLKPIKKEELMSTLRMLGDRCLARQEGALKDSRSRESRQRDMERIRAGLVRDVLNRETGELTRETLREEYYFDCPGEYFQVFLLKIDCDREEMGQAAVGLVKEKAKEILVPFVERAGGRTVFEFEEFTGCGIVNYDRGQREELRRAFRDGVNELDARKNLFGPVEFSLILGTEEEEAAGIPVSAERAKHVLPERWVSGTGKVLESVPRGCGDKRELLENYGRNIRDAMERMDMEEGRRAVRELQSGLMAMPGVCGRDVLEAVSAAGHLFVSRLETVRMEECLQDFVERVGQCGSAAQVFAVLEIMQESLMGDILTVRRNEALRPVRMAKQYVQKHFRESITLEDVCEATGFSVSYFSALFKKETGEGFSKYLTRVRMEEAKNLLRETGLPVAEICERVGYSDRKHFTAVFHKFTGLNPAEYRKLYG